MAMDASVELLMLVVGFAAFGVAGCYLCLIALGWYDLAFGKKPRKGWLWSEAPCAVKLRPILHGSLRLLRTSLILLGIWQFMPHLANLMLSEFTGETHASPGPVVASMRVPSPSGDCDLVVMRRETGTFGLDLFDFYVVPHEKKSKLDPANLVCHFNDDAGAFRISYPTARWLDSGHAAIEVLNTGGVISEYTNEVRPRGISRIMVDLCPAKLSKAEHDRIKRNE